MNSSRDINTSPPGAICLKLSQTTKMVESVLKSLRGTGQIDKSIDPPLWLDDWAFPFDGRVTGPPPNELVACSNGLLHLPTKKLLPHTPAYFNRNALDFAYYPEAPPPKLWLTFLDQAWPGDPQSPATLQESSGSPDHRHQLSEDFHGDRAPALRQGHHQPRARSPDWKTQSFCAETGCS